MTKHNYSGHSQSVTKPNNSVQKTMAPQDSTVTTQFGNASTPIIKKLTRTEIVKRRLKG